LSIKKKAIAILCCSHIGDSALEDILKDAWQSDTLKTSS